MEISRFTSEDLHKIGPLKPEGWPDIIPDFEFYVLSPFCFPIKVCLDGELVGIGTSILFENSAWLAHIIVASHSRNKGIGSAIVKELITQINAKSIKSILLIATDLGKPIYLKAGFMEVMEYRFLKRDVPNIVPRENVHVVNFDERFRQDLYQLDRDISGEGREALIGDYLQDAKIYVKENVVYGFYLPSLKEGLIYANLEEAGLALMAYKYATMDKAVIPAQNLAGLTLLQELGFVAVEKTGRRMLLGDDIDWNASNVYARIGGNFG